MKSKPLTQRVLKFIREHRAAGAHFTSVLAAFKQSASGSDIRHAIWGLIERQDVTIDDENWLRDSQDEATAAEERLRLAVGVINSAFPSREDLDRSLRGFWSVSGSDGARLEGLELGDTSAAGEGEL